VEAAARRPEAAEGNQRRQARAGVLEAGRGYEHEPLVDKAGGRTRDYADVVVPVQFNSKTSRQQTDGTAREKEADVTSWRKKKAPKEKKKEASL